MANPKYIMTTPLSGRDAFLCEIDAEGAYVQIAQGDHADIRKIMNALNEKTDALPVGPEDVVTEAVAPEDIQIGDRILVEMEVTRRDSTGRTSHTHLIAKPVEGQLWMLGDQHAWTWGWSMASAQKIERIVND